MIVRSVVIRFVALLAALVPVLMLLGQLSRLGMPHTIVTFRFVSGEPAQKTNGGVHPTSVQSAPQTGLSVVGGPSISSAVINRLLAAAGSPAVGTGQALYDLSLQYGVDDAYALAVFAQESSFGKFGAASQTHSLGNIICAGYPTCVGRFRAYGSWEEGYADFYRLIAQEYLSRGLVTVEQIVPVYAPSSENDTGAYIANVKRLMQSFRQMR